MCLSHRSHLCSSIISLREWNFSLVTRLSMIAAPGEQNVGHIYACASFHTAPHYLLHPLLGYLPLFPFTFPSVPRSGCEHGRWNCSLEHCPVDGGLSAWSSWSSCSLSCGGLGLKTRTRGCTQPAPAHGGRDCQGPRQETTYCQAPDCPGTGPGHGRVE